MGTLSFEALESICLPNCTIGLILCCIACYYIGPIPVPWWPITVALTLAMALFGLFFLSLILFPVPHWMLAMALSGFLA